MPKREGPIQTEFPQVRVSKTVYNMLRYLKYEFRKETLNGVIEQMLQQYDDHFPRIRLYEIIEERVFSDLKRVFGEEAVYRVTPDERREKPPTYKIANFRLKSGVPIIVKIYIVDLRYFRKEVDIFMTENEELMVVSLDFRQDILSMRDEMKSHGKKLYLVRVEDMEHGVEGQSPAELDFKN